MEEDGFSSEFTIEEAKSLENALYISDEWTVNNQLKMDLGLRVSSLHILGPYTHYNESADDPEVIDTTLYSSNFYNNQYNVEPRIGIKYGMKNSSIKLSYNRMAQYIQQASNGNSSTPFDIWFTTSPNVKPQIANQWALGYFRNFRKNTIEASVELYYKKFSNAIDFKEGAQLLLNKNLEGELRFGEAKAYGIELLLKKDVGRLTGWIAYTYSKIEKNIDGINEGRWYDAKYDKPHDFSVVLSYELNKRMSLSSNFVYSSGSPVTFPTGRYEYNGVVVPVYSDRNGERLPNYHRMDLSLSIKPKKNERRNIKSEWVFSIYNVYNRKNAFAINFKQDDVNPRLTYAEKSAVFSMVPSVTYNIKF